MNVVKINVLVVLIFISSLSNAARVIEDIYFSGPNDPDHPNIVQIHISNGFSTAGCNVSLAAIKNTEDRQHLISFALAAFVSKTPVDIVLYGNDTPKYYGDRCSISRMSAKN